MSAFVPSTSIPDWMAEPVARQKHQRGCGTFDGGRNRPAPAPPYTDEHARHDLLWAKVFISDLCNAFEITPGDLAWLADCPEPHSHAEAGS